MGAPTVDPHRTTGPSSIQPEWRQEVRAREARSIRDPLPRFASDHLALGPTTDIRRLQTARWPYRLAGGRQPKGGTQRSRHLRFGSTEPGHPSIKTIPARPLPAASRSGPESSRARACAGIPFASTGEYRKKTYTPCPGELETPCTPLNVAIE